ncbi:MAG: histidine kinase dimerization/phosphoacceptor domain -containing protein [Methanobacterium sp.]|nr:histidine kinase dimerization/phosphoacceptor domain -containing protein [Methanobacterium sp.]
MNEIKDNNQVEKANINLEHSGAILNSIFEGPENIIAFSLDQNYQYIFFNQAHSQTMKNIWDADIEIGKSMLDYISYPEDREKAKVNFDRVLSGENFIIVEEYGEESLSRNYWENIYNPIQSDKGIIGINVFCIDITERQEAENALKLSQIQLENAMDLAKLANWELDISNKTFTFNDRFYSILGTTAEKEGSYQISLDDYLRKYVHPDDAGSIGELIESSLKERRLIFGREIHHRVVRNDGKTRHVAIVIRVTPPTKKSNVHVYGTVQDVTERKMVEEKLKKSLTEKEVLLKEIHHRVKNNLMVISSLLNLQSQYIKDKEALDIFRESQNRARSMALIHERLYQSPDLKRIDFGDYIQTLSKDLFHSCITNLGRVKMNLNVENLMVDINTTVPLGLIVNELVTNSMKHGFVGDTKGEINIEFHEEGDEFVLVVSDTGVGFPDDIDFRNTSTLGLQLVNNLTTQIDGKIELNKDKGTEFRITFKEQYK